MVSRSERERRKELLRKHGFRSLGQLWIVQTTHRGIGYPVAHACFGCRKSFKMEGGFYTTRPVKCPQCGQTLAWMGRTFKAPKMGDIRQWKKVEALWRAGVRFHSYHAAEPLPETLTEVPSFLERLHQDRIRRFRNAHRAKAE